MTISHTIGGTVGRLFTPSNVKFVIVITDVDAKTTRVNVAVAPEKQGSKDGFRENIQDTVEDGLRVRSDDVATLRQTPGNGIEEPQEDGPNTAGEESLVDVGAESESVFAGSPGDGPGNPEEGNAAKGEVSPLVRCQCVEWQQAFKKKPYLVGRRDERANQASDDHDLVNEQCVPDRGPGKTGSQEQIQQQEWGGDDPEDYSQPSFPASQTSRHPYQSMYRT